VAENSRRLRLPASYLLSSDAQLARLSGCVPVPV
jgi:hypothetical protein